MEHEAIPALEFPHDVFIFMETTFNSCFTVSDLLKTPKGYTTEKNTETPMQNSNSQTENMAHINTICITQNAVDHTYGICGLLPLLC